MITAADILKRKSKVHTFEVDGLGEVCIKPLSASATTKFQLSDNPIDMLAMATVLSMCDTKGELLFKPDQIEDLVDSLGFKELETIATEAMKISGLVEPKK